MFISAWWNSNKQQIKAETRFHAKTGTFELEISKGVKTHGPTNQQNGGSFHDRRIKDTKKS